MSNGIIFMFLGALLTSLVVGRGEVSAISFSVGQLDRHCRSYLKLIRPGRKGRLTTAQAVDIVKCNSFIAGFHMGKVATNTLNDTFGPYCLPHGEKTTTNWLIRTFVRWVARHPAQKNRAAAVGVMRALREGYACEGHHKRK